MQYNLALDRFNLKAQIERQKLVKGLLHSAKREGVSVPDITSTALLVCSRERNSVTRFGEILPQYYQSLAFLDGLFSIWQNCEPTLVNFLCHWANIHCC